MLSSHSKIWFNFDKTGSAGGRDTILVILMLGKLFECFPADKEGQRIILTRAVRVGLERGVNTALFRGSLRASVVPQ